MDTILGTLKRIVNVGDRIISDFLILADLSDCREIIQNGEIRPLLNLYPIYIHISLLGDVIVECALPISSSRQ